PRVRFLVIGEPVRVKNLEAHPAVTNLHDFLLERAERERTETRTNGNRTGMFLDGNSTRESGQNEQRDQQSAQHADPLARGASLRQGEPCVSRRGAPRARLAASPGCER